MTTLKMHIQGYDEYLQGGIPEGHIVLISGGPGTLKSSISFNFLYHNAMVGNKCLYLSFEQTQDSIVRQMKKFGYNLNLVRGNLRVHDTRKWRELLEEAKVEGGKLPSVSVFKEVVKIIETIEAKILVLDSLNSLYVLSNFLNPRDDLYKFFKKLRDLKITAFLISEVRGDSNVFGVYDEDYLADGIFHLVTEKVKGEDVVRKIRCVKMREVDHATGYFTISFEGGKFIVKPPKALTG